MNEFSSAIREFFKEKKKKNGFQLEDLLDVGAEIELDVGEKIEEASKNASEIELASHVMKFSHSSSDGSNILFEPGDLESNAEMKHYISSETLTNRKLDIAYKNAKYSSEASLVMLEVGGETLLDCLRRGDSSPLEPFAKSSDQLKSWMERFTKIEPKKPPSAHRAKQIFFPLDDGSYHLLAPLFSSSLCHYFYENINSEEAKMAKIKIGGSNSQNVSFLNSKRKGTVYLFNAEPPERKDLKKPPLTEKIFWRDFFRDIREKLREYIEFIKKERGNNRKFGLESKDLRLKIYHDLFENVENIYRFEPGWSKNSSLDEAFRFWLDPRNEEFEDADADTDWKEIIAERFKGNLDENFRTLDLTLDMDDRQLIKKEFLDEFRRRF